jgi:hydrophobic/amphiphilic exporter-1 (mainly G- bacteria), HAE1 family
MWLSDLSIKKPVFAVMLIGALVVLGWISLQRLGVDLFPRVEFPIVTVSTVLDGASPEVIETDVTDKLEEQVNTLSGIESMNSQSAEGVSRVIIEFGLEQDIDVKAQDVRDKVALAIRELPADAEAPIVQRIDPDSDPIMSVMIAGDTDIAALTRYADKTVKERLQRLPGVGSVSIVGGREREIRIWLDAGRLRAYGVTAQEVIDAIRRDNAEIPGGILETPGARAELAVKTRGKVASVEEFKKIVVAFRANGLPTTVGDVARVEDGLKDERSFAALDGQPGVSLEIRRQSGENTLNVARAVKAEIAKLRASLPPGMRMEVARDISTFIEASAFSVFEDIIIGIILVIIITLAFLISPRATVIVAMAMPTSLIATFLLFYWAGFTLNLLTLMALAISVGLLVDDAIVVLESIHRKLEEGEAPEEAARKGTAQVAGAVIAGTLAVVAVFVPIAFMEGIVGRFFMQYGLAIVFAVMVSLLVSLTLTPMLCAKFLKKEMATSRIGKATHDFHLRLDAWYARVLRASIRHKGLVVLGAFATIIAGFFVAATIPASFQSRSDRAEFLAEIHLPYGTGLAASREVGSRVAEAMRQVPEVRSVFLTIGGDAQGKINEVKYFVSLTPKGERAVDQFKIMQDVREAMTAAAPEATFTGASDIPWVQGGNFQSEISYTLQGPDLAVLRQKADEITAKMRASGIFVDVRSSFEDGKPEVQYTVDRDKAADLGVPVRALATTLRAMVGGVKAGTYEEFGEQFDVRVRLEADQREDIGQLGIIQVRAADGQAVDLSAVAAPFVEAGPSQIDRRNRARAVSIFANMRPGHEPGAGVVRMNEIGKEAALGEGYAFKPFGQAEQMAKTGAAILFAFFLALLSLYMILASQFNSFGQPAIMMIAAPLSFFGAFVALKISGLPMTMFAQIGLIALMGLVLKNGILLVDHANEMRLKGASAEEAILDAGRVRMRPVLMTALSTIFGMLPAAISNAYGAEFRAPMAVLIVGGIMSSTVLTLVVVPAAYLMAANAGRYIKRGGEFIRTRMSRKGPEKTPEPAE